MLYRPGSLDSLSRKTLLRTCVSETFRCKVVLMETDADIICLACRGTVTHTAGCGNAKHCVYCEAQFDTDAELIEHEDAGCPGVLCSACGQFDPAGEHVCDLEEFPEPDPDFQPGGVDYEFERRNGLR